MALITSITSGNWSDPNIWDTGTVPTAGDDVVIGAGTVVTIDTSIGDIGSDSGSNDAIRIEGELRWNGDVDCTITCWGHFHQVSGGIVNFDGTSDRTKTLTIYLNASNSPSYTKYQIIIEDVTNYNINGYVREDNWVKVFNTSNGATNTQVKEISRITDWQIGDEIVFLKTGYRVDIEKYTITNINGDIIEFTPALTFDVPEDYIVINITKNIRYIAYSQLVTIRHNFPNLTSTDMPIKYKNVYFENLNNSDIHSENESCFPIGTYFVLDGVVSIFNHFFPRREVHPSHIELPPINNCVFYEVWRKDNSFPFQLSYTAGYFNDYEVNLNNSAICNIAYYLGIKTQKSITAQNNFFNGWNLSFDPEYEDRLFYNCDFVDFYVIGVRGGLDKPPTDITFKNCRFEGNTIIEITAPNDFINCEFNLNWNATIEIRGQNKFNEFIYYIGDRYSIKAVSYGDAKFFFYNINNEHDYYDYYQHAYNQQTIKYNNNEAVEIQAIQTGQFELTTKILVDNNTSYKFDLFLMKDSSTSQPPKVQLWKGATLLDEAVMPDTVNNWEKLSVSWFSDFDGFITLKFVFNSDTRTEKFWISDERNSFHYWSEGYIIPVYPRNEVTPDTVAKAVWEYANRTLTSSAGFTEEDRVNLFLIKEKTDKIRFTNKNEVISFVGNLPSILQNQQQSSSTKSDNRDILVEIERLRNLILNISKKGGF